MRACLSSKIFFTASLSKSVLCHLHPHTHAVNKASAERRNTHLAVSGKSFTKFKPSTSNQVVALLFHVMNAKSATVALSSTRYPEGRSARTDSKTPKTRFISLSYRSTALGIFSLWNFWNHAAWPKYGLYVDSMSLSYIPDLRDEERRTLGQKPGTRAIEARGTCSRRRRRPYVPGRTFRPSIG